MNFSPRFFILLCIFVSAKQLKWFSLAILTKVVFMSKWKQRDNSLELFETDNRNQQLDIWSVYDDFHLSFTVFFFFVAPSICVNKGIQMYWLPDKLFIHFENYFVLQNFRFRTFHYRAIHQKMWPFFCLASFDWTKWTLSAWHL